jgi:hypothetical protein
MVTICNQYRDSSYLLIKTLLSSVCTPNTREVFHSCLDDIAIPVTVTSFSQDNNPSEAPVMDDERTSYPTVSEEDFGPDEYGAIVGSLITVDYSPSLDMTDEDPRVEAFLAAEGPPLYLF